MATSKRLTRHELKDPDQILTTFDHALRWILDHPRKVKQVIGAVVLAGLLVAAGTVWFQARARRTNDALAELIKTYRRPVAPAERVDGLEPFASQAAKDAAVAAEAEAFVSTHGNGGAGRGADMLRAQTLARTGKYQEAVELYGRVAGSTPADTLAAAAVLARASARAAAGQNDEAVAELKRMASGANRYISKELLLERAAVIAEASNQLVEAQGLYERLANEATDEGTKAQSDRRAKELRKRIEAAEPRAATTAPQPIAPTETVDPTTPEAAAAGESVTP